VVINPFLRTASNLYSEWHLSGKGSHPEKAKKPDVSHLCQWILCSWGRIYPGLVVIGIRKYSLSVILNGSEEDVIDRIVEKTAVVKMKLVAVMQVTVMALN
jgi:hypothetical protein